MEAALSDDQRFNDLRKLCSCKDSVAIASWKSKFPEAAALYKRNWNFAREFHNWIEAQCSPFTSFDMDSADAIHKAVVEFQNVDDVVRILRAQRLALIYAALVIHYHLALHVAMLMLSKLAALPWAQLCDNESIQHNSSSSSFDICGLAEFFVNVTKTLQPFIAKLGSDISSAFASSPALRVLSPDTCSLLHNAATEGQRSVILNHDDYIAVAYSGNFIRRFRDDIDSRLEYNSQVNSCDI